MIILAAGTGNPYFTTDTAAALRAVEIGAQVLLKATKVDGVYDSDPMTNPDAQRHERLEYSQMLTDRLQVIDCHGGDAVHGERPADRRVRHEPARATSVPRRWVSRIGTLIDNGEEHAMGAKPE